MKTQNYGSIDKFFHTISACILDVNDDEYDVSSSSLLALDFPTSIA